MTFRFFKISLHGIHINFLCPWARYMPHDRTDLGFATRVFSEEYKLWGTSLCSSLQPSITPLGAIIPPALCYAIPCIYALPLISSNSKERINVRITTIVSHPGGKTDV